MADIETRTDILFEKPYVTIQQRTTCVNVSIQETGDYITELKLYADSVADVLAVFEDRFEGTERVAVNFNHGQASAWFYTEHADKIQEELARCVDIGLRQVITV